MPISFFPSTKSGFLCFIWVWNPCFRAFRAQNRGFCAFLGFGTLVFGLFEHKIEVFVRFCPPEPPFSGLSSTKSAFLCSGRRGLAPGCVNIAFLQITAMQSCGQMLPAELATLPHRPWTPMSSVNGRVPASEAQREGWSEAEVCAEELAAPQKPLR